jgi:hypothetical protein
MMMTIYGSSSSPPWPETGQPDSWQARESADMRLGTLKQAAEDGDEQAFVDAAEMIDWSSSDVGVFHEGVRLALMAGAHLLARSLASKGAALYPQDPELQKMARILGPPRVLSTDIAASSSPGAARAWLRDHADEYAGRWVALQEGTLLAAAATAREVWDSLDDTDGVLVMRVF